MTQKLLVRPATKQTQLLPVALLANQDMTAGAYVLDVPDTYDPATWTVNFATKTVGLDLSIVDARLTASVKKESERRKMQAFTNGFGKSQEYVLKGKEATSSASVLTTVLNALTAANAAAQYPMAQAERTLTGETLSVVLARYRASKSTSDAELARLSAIEWKAVQTIKAASTAAAKQAAYAAINWNQSA